MRHMPTTLSADRFLRTPGGPLPTVSRLEFDRKMQAMVGALSPDEVVSVQKMLDHGWSLIVIANELLVARGCPEWPIGKPIP